MPQVTMPAQRHERQEGQLEIPEQPTTTLANARETARTLGGELSYFDRVIADIPKLQDAALKWYFVALEPINVPEIVGWNRIIRKRDGRIEYKPIKEKEAIRLIRQDRFDEVLRWSEDAQKAAKEGHPVALRIWSGYGHTAFIDADDWHTIGYVAIARIALILRR